jgi:large subunit ribosomal protein L5e
MGFVKVQKNKAYFKRFQVKFRRRRECKTDYYARQRLITQDKNKYKTPKYRLVVRFTNRDVICQIFSSDLTHDVCLAAAYSHELLAFGLKAASTNYATAYATGLLLARRVNAKLGLNYEGNTNIDGEDYNVEAPDDEAKKPFKAILDVGLRRTTTGARLFGALKGACDGGIDVPHNDHRFPGSKREQKKEWSTNPAKHREYIFGLHVAAYMRLLKDDADSYQKQFSRYIKAGISADNIEKMYKEVHAAIRKNPATKRDPLAVGYFTGKKRAAARPVKAKAASAKAAGPATFKSKKELALERKRLATQKPVRKVNKFATGKRSNAQRHNRINQKLQHHPAHKDKQPIDDILKPKARD